MTATQKIVNGTFETGDFTGWTIKDPDNQPEVVDVFPFLGVYCASLDTNDADYGGWIAQDVSATEILTDYVNTFRLALHGYSGIVPNVTTLDVTLTYSDLETTVIHLSPGINWVNVNLKSYLTANKTLTDIKIQVVSNTRGMVIHVDEVTLTYEVPVETGYCDHDLIKERLLIESTDETYDAELDSAAVEASRLIDIYLTPYTTVPLGGDIPEQILYICADFAASIFKRRMMPSEVNIRGQLSPEGGNVIEASGWWALALKKLEEYIKSTYHLADKAFTWSTVQDPDVVLRALDRRVIGIAEARALLKAMTSDTTSKTEAEIDLIEHQIELIDAQIAKMVQDGLLVEAQTLKLAGVDTDKVEAETSLITAETLNVPKTGDEIDARTELIEAQTTKLGGIDTDILTEQALKIQVESDKLSGVDTGKVTAEIDVLEAELTRMSADLTKITAENSVLTQQVLNLKAVVTNLTAVNAKLAAETADIIEKTEQLPKRGTIFVFCDEDEEEEEP